MWPNSDTLNSVFDKVNSVYSGSLNKLDEGKNYVVDNTVNNGKKIWSSTSSKYEEVKNYVNDKLVFEESKISTSTMGDSGSDAHVEHFGSAPIGKVNIGSSASATTSDYSDNDGFFADKFKKLKNLHNFKSGSSNSIGAGSSHGPKHCCGQFGWNQLSSLSKTDLLCLVGGMTSTALCVYGFRRYCYNKLNKTSSYLSYKDYNNQIILVLGSMVDPITRAQVYDLYKKGFIIYVCSSNMTSSDEEDDEDSFDATGDFTDKKKHAGAEEEEWVKSSDEYNNNDAEMIRLNYISTKPQDLSKLVKTIRARNWRLCSIILSHNNVSNNLNLKNFENGINNNLIQLIKVIYKITPFFKDVKVVLLNPSFSLLIEQSNAKKNDGSKSSLETFSSHIITGLFETLQNTPDFRQKNNKVYMVHLGLLSFGNNGETLANYKYLQQSPSVYGFGSLNDEYRESLDSNNASLSLLKGGKIQETFLNPVSNLIMGKHCLLRFLSRQCTKNVMYCGSGSTLFMKYDSWKCLRNPTVFKAWINTQIYLNYFGLWFGKTFNQFWLKNKVFFKDLYTKVKSTTQDLLKKEQD
ncbi:hypothetical protein ACO0QE_003983 [Hanseniaspora vineae]